MVASLAFTGVGTVVVPPKVEVPLTTRDPRVPMEVTVGKELAILSVFPVKTIPVPVAK